MAHHLQRKRIETSCNPLARFSLFFESFCIQNAKTSFDFILIFFLQNPTKRIEAFDPKDLKISVDYDPHSTDFKKRKIESHSIGNAFNGFGQSGPFPLVQITKTQQSGQLHIHLYIPFLEDKLRVYVYLNRIVVSGVCQRNKFINEVNTDQLLEFKHSKALDELIFLEGPFEKEIYLGEVVDPTSLTFEAPDKFIRILHLNVKMPPPLGYEA